MADNPWPSLPDSPPFVLANDKRAIEAFNQKAKKNAIIQTDMLPEPFVGSLHAPVFVLLENPGAGGCVLIPDGVHPPVTVNPLHNPSREWESHLVALSEFCDKAVAI